MLVVAVVVLLGLAIFLAERYDLYDGTEWRRASEPKSAYAYLLMFVAIAIGGAALFFYGGQF